MTIHDPIAPLAAAPSPVDLSFIVGGRRIVRARRSLVTVAYELPDLLGGQLKTVPPLPPEAGGYRLLSLPEDRASSVRQEFPGFAVGPPDRYKRHYIDMSGDFDDYLAQFSGKTRQTLRRKSRKVAQLNGGKLDLRTYHRPDEIATFMAIAGELSGRTYQERLLDAGLPTGPQAVCEATRLANEDRLRAYLLFVDGRPVSYLYLPVSGPETAQTLVYAHLGYDPQFARHSAGTVLQMAALEQLFAEGRFRWFDFTEGNGAHKALFATDCVTCANLILLRPGLRNRTLLGARSAFDGMVELASGLAERAGVKARLVRMLRN